MRMGAARLPRFGTDGVRGVAGSELTTSFVELLGRASARVLGSTTILVGRDPRPSSPEYARAVGQGASAAGATVVDVGMLPTPALAWLASMRGAAAAMITASHNPHTDNGVKVFAVGGHKLADDVERRIEEQLTALSRAELHDGEASNPAISTGSITFDDGAAHQYVEHMVASFPIGVLNGLHLVVDCANGAMSTVAPEVLIRLGARLTVLNADPRGTNINEGCGATHPEAVLAAVRQHGADAGLAFDGDGDRVIAATKSGLIDGDRLLAIVAPALHARGELAGGAVAVTVMSNLGFRRAMRDANIRVVETPVGDRYVLEALEREELVLGGEQSGHIILRDRATTGDGLLAALVLLEVAQVARRSLDDLATGAMVQFPQVLINVRTTRRDPNVAQLVADEVQAAETALGDQGRVLIRASGTEPLVRVMVEAATERQAREQAERLAAAVTARIV